MSPERRQEKTKHKEQFQLTGRVFYLTKDPELIRAQIEGIDLGLVDPKDLRDRISTDEIIPSWASMRHSDPEHLGRFLLTGIPEIKPDDLKGKFQIIVAGKSFGRGSSREHAQLALRGAEIELVAATSHERIFKDNCANYDIFTLKTTDPHYQQIIEKKPIPIENLLAGEDQISREIIEAGGLLPYTKARLEGKTSLPEVETPIRPMTIAEKIIAKHAKIAHKTDLISVKPGDTMFVGIDSGYAYELQSVISQEVLEQTFPFAAPVKPEKFYLFEDHLALMESDDPVTVRHRENQKTFAEKYGLKLYHVTDEGVEGICHTVMVERHILPGDLVLGNDSHTCTGGAANALAVGKGASEFAAALLTEDVSLTVPETIRFDLQGQLAKGVTSKDLMLHILSLPEMRDELLGSNRVWEFGGPSLDEMPFDDQLVLTNMTIEGQGFTGIIEPNEQLVNYMMTQHKLHRTEVMRMLIYPDENAQYSHTFNIDLGKIEKMVALPGDTQNAIPLSQLPETKVDFAYILACTGGKLKDLVEAAAVLAGRKVNPNVKMRVQASSLSVYRQALAQGLVQIFQDAGAEFIKPGCGDCMGATKEALVEKRVAISSSNRSFSGRMGRETRAYLASPDVVAASAIRGKIASPDELS